MRFVEFLHSIFVSGFIMDGLQYILAYSIFFPQYVHVSPLSTIPYRIGNPFAQLVHLQNKSEMINDAISKMTKNAPETRTNVNEEWSRNKLSKVITIPTEAILSIHNAIILYFFIMTKSPYTV